MAGPDKAPAPREDDVKVGWVTPTTGCFGAVREMVEVSNVLVERGHQVTIYSPDGEPCRWLECRAEYGTTGEVVEAGLDAVLGIVDWQPGLYRTVVESGAPMRAICLMGFTPSEQLATMLRGDAPIHDSSTRVLRKALDDPEVHILADSQWQLDWIREHLGRPVGVAFGGVNAAMFRPREGERREGPYRLGASGDPRDRKGTDTVEAAIEMIRERAPKVEFSTYWGQRYDQAQLVAWYQDADIFLDGHRRGGWCNPVVEAMACGCAVVCTKIGATSAVAHDGRTARVVPVDDPRAMADAALWLLGDAGRMARLSASGMAWIQQYDYRYVVLALEDYLTEALA